MMIRQVLRRKPTIIDVAHTAGVSKSTVSRVLQGTDVSVKAETRLAVMRAIKKLGYEHNAIARSLRTHRTQIVMAITPDITNPFWPEVTRGLQDVLQQADYSVVLGNSDWDPVTEKMLIRTAHRNRFDALAINPTAISTRELLALGIPIVILGVREDISNIDTVGSDSFGGTLAALTYLHQLGHRRIGFIRGQPRSGIGRARYNAYQEFLKRFHLPFDESLIVQVPFDRESGRRAMQTLLGLPRPPSAVFASNDILAIGAMEATLAAGWRIPADISIIGMDDIYAASMTTPPLTTMAKAKYEIGRQAAEFLLERLGGTAPRQARRVVLPCKLIERGSVAPPPA